MLTCGFNMFFAVLSIRNSSAKIDTCDLVSFLYYFFYFIFGGFFSLFFSFNMKHFNFFLSGLKSILWGANASLTFPAVMGRCRGNGRFHRCSSIWHIFPGVFHISVWWSDTISAILRMTKGWTEDMKSIFKKKNKLVNKQVPSSSRTGIWRSPAGHWKMSGKFSERATAILEELNSILQTSSSPWKNTFQSLSSLLILKRLPMTHRCTRIPGGGLLGLGKVCLCHHEKITPNYFLMMCQLTPLQSQIPHHLPQVTLQCSFNHPRFLFTSSLTEHNLIWQNQWKCDWGIIDQIGKFS